MLEVASRAAPSALHILAIGLVVLCFYTSALQLHAYCIPLQTAT